MQALLTKIRELLWTMTSSELAALEKCLCSMEEPDLSSKKPLETKSSIPPSAYGPAAYTSEFVQKFYANYPSCRTFTPELSSLYSVGKKSERHDRKRDRSSKVSRSSRARQERLNEKCLARLTDGEERPRAQRKRRRSSHSHSHRHQYYSSSGASQSIPPPPYLYPYQYSSSTSNDHQSNLQPTHYVSQSQFNATMHLPSHSSYTPVLLPLDSDSDHDAEGRRRRHRGSGSHRQSSNRSDKRNSRPKPIKEIVCSCGSETIHTHDNTSSEQLQSHEVQNQVIESSEHSQFSTEKAEAEGNLQYDELSFEQQSSLINDLDNVAEANNTEENHPSIQECVSNAIAANPSLQMPDGIYEEFSYVSDLSQQAATLTLEENNQSCENCNKEQNCNCKTRTSSPDYFADHSLTENTPPTSPNSSKCINNPPPDQISCNNCESSCVSCDIVSKDSEDLSKSCDENNIRDDQEANPSRSSEITSVVDEDPESSGRGEYLQAQLENKNIDGCSSGSTSPHHSGTEDDEEVALALQAAEVAATWRARAR